MEENKTLIQKNSMLQDLIQTKVNLILTYLMNSIFYQINEKTSKTAFNDPILGT